MGIFDPYAYTKLVAELLGDVDGRQWVYDLDPKPPAEPSPAQTEKDAASGKSA